MVNGVDYVVIYLVQAADDGGTSLGGFWGRKTFLLEHFVSVVIIEIETTSGRNYVHHLARY